VIKWIVLLKKKKVIKWIVIYLFVFQIHFTQKFRCVNHGPKVGELNRTTENRLWIWDPVRGYGLHNLLYTRYSTVTHVMITMMCERWHLETSSFQLSVGDMTITLDDVANILLIPIEGCMLDYERKVGVELDLDPQLQHLLLQCLLLNLSHWIK